MTEEEQNKAIAAACGRLYHRPSDRELKSGSYYQFEPRYTRDLNYMHEAEKAKAVDKDAFIFYLCGVLAYSCASAEALEACVFATAAQRAEAFLRALNLWKN